MKGGSLVLTTMLIPEHGFHLDSKVDFHNFLKLLFGLPLFGGSQMCKISGFVGRRGMTTLLTSLGAA